jgi:Na+-driven multidrug efflux pump
MWYLTGLILNFIGLCTAKKNKGFWLAIVIANLIVATIFYIRME